MGACGACVLAGSDRKAKDRREEIFSSGFPDETLGRRIRNVEKIPRPSAGEVRDNEPVFLEDRMTTTRVRSGKLTPGMPGARAAVLLAALGVAVWTGTGTAQSPNAFGTPSAGKPAPTSAINAVPGSRAQGWLAQGRSEIQIGRASCRERVYVLV